MFFYFKCIKRKKKALSKKANFTSSVDRFSFNCHNLHFYLIFLLYVLQHVKTSCQTVQCISSLRPSVMALKSSLPSTAQVLVATAVNNITVIWLLDISFEIYLSVVLFFVVCSQPFSFLKRTGLLQPVVQQQLIIG